MQGTHSPTWVAVKDLNELAIFRIDKFLVVWFPYYGDGTKMSELPEP